MDRCEKYVLLLGRYLDEELSHRQKLRFETHLQTCPTCRAQLDTLRLQGELFREKMNALTSQVDFSGFEESVLRKIQQQTPPSALEQLVFWLREFFYRYRAVWISSLITAAVLAALLIPILRETEPSTQVAQADNELIIDSMKYTGQKAMIFTVSKNNTTVIWLYDFDQAEKPKDEGDEL